MSRIMAELRAGTWLTYDRIKLYIGVLLIFEMVMLAFFAAGTHGLIVPLAGPNTTDFVSFYAAGRLANAGNAPAAYDHLAHHLMEQIVTQPGIAYNYFFYPPPFLLICGLLARLPYLPAFYAFQAVTILLYLLAIKPILPNARTWQILAFPAAFWTFGMGQNAFLTASLLAAATWSVDRRPWRAGLLFGSLCYKPHIGLLIPLALAAGRHKRAFAAAAAAVIGWITLSLWMFGWQTWEAFFLATAGAQTVYGAKAIDMAGLASPYGATLVLGGSFALACGVQICVSSGVGALVALAWRCRVSLPARAAALIAGTPLAVPVLLFYDLMLDGLALAWLIRAGQQAGFPPWHRSGLGLLFLMPLLSGNLDSESKLLIAPLTAALGFALAASRVLHERRQARSAISASV